MDPAGSRIPARVVYCYVPSCRSPRWRAGELRRELYSPRSSCNPRVPGLQCAHQLILGRGRVWAIVLRLLLGRGRCFIYFGLLPSEALSRGSGFIVLGLLLSEALWRGSGVIVLGLLQADAPQDWGSGASQSSWQGAGGGGGKSLNIPYCDNGCPLTVSLLHSSR